MVKRIVVILIIAFCLLFCVEISCLAKDTANPGRTWNSLSVESKTYFIKGFVSGIHKCFDKIVTEPISLGGDAERGLQVLEIIDLAIFVQEHQEVVINVMDDLYKDPANTYISLALICELAYYKIKGEDIELLLREARKEALR